MPSKTILWKLTQPDVQLLLIQGKLIDNEKKFTQNIVYTEIFQSPYR
jgi:hypothetical protein